MTIPKKNIDYVRWQNRSFRFYLGARLLLLNEMYSPACYSLVMSIELLLKATLIYWDKSFRPEDYNHNFNKLIKTLNNKVPNSRSLDVPEYFYAGDRYLTVTRYPSNDLGFLIPTRTLGDLDKCYADILMFVPYQFNTELINTLETTKNPSNDLCVLRKKNQQITRIRRFLKSHFRKTDLTS